MTAQDLACSSSGCFPEIEVSTVTGSTVILKAQAIVRPHRRLVVFGKLNEANSLLRTFEVDLDAFFSGSLCHRPAELRTRFIESLLLPCFPSSREYATLTGLSPLPISVIMLFLSVRDAANLANAANVFLRVFREESLWNLLLSRDYPRRAAGGFTMRSVVRYKGYHEEARRQKQEAERRALLISQQQQYMPARGMRHPTGTGSLGPIGLLDGNMQGRRDLSTEEILFGMPGLGPSLGPNTRGPQRFGSGYGNGPSFPFGSGLGSGGSPFGRGPFG